jgi:hypothetical protein
MSDFTIFMTCFGFVVGGFAGMLTFYSAKAGLGLAVTCALAGLLTGTVVGAQEVASWKYTRISQITDCRMRTAITAALSDRKMTEGEYDALMDRQNAYELDSARNQALGTEVAQCATTKARTS